MKRSYLFPILVAAALVFPYAATANSYTSPGTCPPVSFSASSSQGVSPLTVTLTIDARAYLRCVFPSETYDPGSSVRWEATYITSTGSGETYTYTPPAYRGKLGVQGWFDLYGVFSVTYTYSPGDRFFIPKGQVDVRIIGNVSTAFLGSAWADAQVTTTNPPVSVNLTLDGYSGSISKTAGSTANATWGSSKAD